MYRQEWFGEWFDSPYYYILYRSRDVIEAQMFMDSLIQNIKPGTESKFLDVACGRGRHAIYLNSKGFDVTGIDLSTQNIEVANQSKNEKLRFVEHDMRDVYKANEFDFAFNLFTSFGYFDSLKEDQQAISAIALSLKKGGHFLLDFLNPYAVINDLVEAETKIIDGIKFNISRRYDGEFIYKDIVINDAGKIQSFQEKVRAIRRADFLEYFENAGLKVKSVFGNYSLGKYKKEKSERLIYLTQL
ncbi:MAG: SAM-dependent methyltransferase [Cyclobacteriaceae bacterium]|jgi:SAM-dependent methyltransferase